MMNDSDTEQLVDLAHQGDATAVTLLMQRHRRRLKRMVRARMDRRIAGRIDPSDVIQETLTTACQQLPRYLEAPRIPFYPWLRRIAWQTLAHLHEQHLDAAKRSVKREQHENWQLSDQSAIELAQRLSCGRPSPSTHVRRHELFERLKILMSHLSDRDREIILQRYLEQMSIQEIAASMDLSEATVRMRHLRAIQKLQKLMQAEELP